MACDKDGCGVMSTTEGRREKPIWKIVNVLVLLLLLLIIWNSFSPFLAVKLSDQANIRVMEYESLALIFDDNVQKHLRRLYSTYESKYGAATNIPDGYENFEVFIGVQKITDQTGYRTDIVCHMRLNCGCSDEQNRFCLVIARIDPISLETSVLFDHDIPWSEYDRQLYRVEQYMNTDEG